MEKTLAAVSAEKILDHIEILASDNFAGRKPGTVGEQATLQYLIEQCQALGLTPGVGSEFLQNVQVRGITSRPVLTFSANDGKVIKPTFPDQFVAMSRSKTMTSQVKIANSEIVFVGYGIKAPEYDWDDYKDVDVRGKTVVMLIGDPKQTHSASGKLDADFFRGEALTYYGRWTYKFEIASQLGAAAVFIVHDTAGAGYQFDVVKASWSGENFALLDDGGEERVKAEGWICQDVARELFNTSVEAGSGGKPEFNLDFDSLVVSANQRDFSPITLSARADIYIENTYRQFSSANVVARLKSTSVQETKDTECIIYSAHWDHFGMDANGGVFSGAVDNASGVAVILEAARALKALVKEIPAHRDVLFLFTTLEEYGLLGSQHYVVEPCVPLSKTLAVFNVDIMNLWGRTAEVVSIALGHSSLDEDLAAAAALQKRSVVGDPEPGKGYFYRSDHLEFIRRGVPAIFFLQPGSSFIGKPANFGDQMRLRYLTEDYHKVGDKVKPDWDLSGIVEDTQLLVATGLRVLQNKEKPKWKATSEFCIDR